MKMKFLISVKMFVGIVLITTWSYGQNTTGSSFVSSALDKMVNVPNSPEAMAFSKYGDIDVNMYHGQPNITLPLYEIVGRELSLPFFLNYDASGIKVEQLATWVGLGWNLNVGGRITRLTMGLPDDYINGNYVTTNDGRISERTELIQNIEEYLANTSKVFSSEQAVRDYFLFLDDINNNFLDAQPDVFQINAPGLSTSIVFDIEDNNTPKSLDNPRIKINQVIRGINGNNEILGWIITNENGTRYTFGVTSTSSSVPVKHEQVKRLGNDNSPSGIINNEYVSSWVLTKIESPNKKDIYEFDYYDTGYWNQPLFASAAVMSGVRIQLNKTYYSENEVSVQLGGGTDYKISQQFVSSIKHNGHRVVDFSRGSRTDIAYEPNVNARLDQITIYDYNLNAQRFIDFDNDGYFNSNGTQPLDKRLKLDKVIFKDKYQNQIKEYILEYDRPDELPSRLDLGQDYGGYYNGANNQVLFPRYEYQNFVFEGADRQPKENYAKIGTLKKIIYPTGGYTEFEYESNESLQAPQDTSNQEWNNVLYANVSVTAGFDTTTPCGLCCQDMYGSPTPPKVASVIFTVEEEGNYNVDYFDNAVGGNIQEAYIHRINSGPCEVDSQGPIQLLLSPLPYDEIVDECAPIQNGLVWNKTSNPIDQIFLTPGCYQVTLAIGNFNTNTIGVTVWRPELVDVGGGSVGQIIERPGIRVKSIKSYDGDGAYASGKSYSYLSQKNNHIPILSKVSSTNQGTFLERTTSYPQGSAPMITYPKVREYFIDDNGNNEGYVDYTFCSNNGGIVPHLNPPFQLNFWPELKSGKLVGSQVFDAGGNEISNQNTAYFESFQSPISMKGLAIFINIENATKWPYIKTVPGGYSYEMVEAQCSIGQGGQNFGESEWDEIMRAGFHETSPGPGQENSLNGEGCVLPCLGDWQNCAPFVGLMDRVYGALEIKENFVHGSYGGISVQTDTTYLRTPLEGFKKLVNSSETFYEEDSGYYFPLKTINTDSKGETYRTTRTFPIPNDPDYNSFYEKNRLTEVVAQKTEKLNAGGTVEKFISAMKMEYYNSSVALVPSKTYSSKKGDANADLEERETLTYYPNGNVKESRTVGGPTTTYIWGYDDMYLVAKVENATYSQVTATGFSQGNLNSLTNTEATKSSELQIIRNGLPNALVTSYTYEPSIGITSITDPKGDSLQYEYDDYNRLKAIKDAAGNLVEDYRYKYKNQ